MLLFMVTSRSRKIAGLNTNTFEVKKRMKDALIEQFNGVSRELSSYLCRFVIRPQVGAELKQRSWSPGHLRGLPRPIEWKR